MFTKWCVSIANIKSMAHGCPKPYIWECTNHMRLTRRLQGLNTGVVLYHLKRMRESWLYNSYLHPEAVDHLMERFLKIFWCSYSILPSLSDTTSKCLSAIKTGSLPWGRFQLLQLLVQESISHNWEKFNFQKNTASTMKLSFWERKK